MGADLNTDDAALLEDVGEADAVIYGSALINGRLPESEKRRIATHPTAAARERWRYQARPRPDEAAAAASRPPGGMTGQQHAYLY